MSIDELLIMLTIFMCVSKQFQMRVRVCLDVNQLLSERLDRKETKGTYSALRPCRK